MLCLWNMCISCLFNSPCCACSLASCHGGRGFSSDCPDLLPAGHCKPAMDGKAQPGVRCCSYFLQACPHCQGDPCKCPPVSGPVCSALQFGLVPAHSANWPCFFWGWSLGPRRDPGHPLQWELCGCCSHLRRICDICPGGMLSPAASAAGDGRCRSSWGHICPAGAGVT